MNRRSLGSIALLAVALTLALPGTFCRLCAQTPMQSSAGGDSTWRDHDRAARDARNRGDWREALTQVLKVDTLLSGHPAVAIGIARASLHVGDTAAAVAALERVARMGLANQLADSDFVALRAARPDLVERLRGNARARGAMRTIATLPQRDFVAEGIVYDATRRRLLVSSIRYGVIVQIDARGVARDYADLVHDGGWSGFGLALDSARGRLWVGTSWQPHNTRAPRADSGTAAVLQYDLASGKLRKRFDFAAGAHEPGDLCVGPSGDLYVSDGRQGEISVVRDGSDSLAQLVRRGALVSPQGCAVEQHGSRMLVADYALGIVAVDTRTGTVSLLPRSRSIAVNGIDGMILRGHQLIGVQNGVNPNRVVVLDLDRANSAIGTVRVLVQDTMTIREPTHLTLMEGDVAFIANGGFGLFDNSGKLRDSAQLAAPKIGRLSLRPANVIRVDTTATKRSLLDADRALARAWSTRGPATFLDAAASDAAILFPVQPILRASAARSAWLQRYEKATTFSWRPLHAVAGVDGTFGCTTGVSRVMAAGDTAAPQRRGVYITCWERSGGRWRIVAHQRTEGRPDSSDLRVLPNAPHSATVAFDGNAAAEAQDADEAFARLAESPAGPGPAFARFVADDGMLIGAPTKPSGPQRIERQFETFPANRVLLWDPAREFGAGRGGLAVSVGNSLTRDRGSDAGQQAVNKYLTVWRQAPDGRWEYILDLGSSRPRPAAQPTTR